MVDLPAPACIACHTVDSRLVASGGKLAMNLTTMGGALYKNHKTHHLQL